jgi:acyl-CoA thioester hydrolase
MTAPAQRPQPHAFCWPIRVYYEDTDAAGVVYYANYLKFLERARTEWIASLGFPISVLESEHNAIFVVNRLEIDYRRPARLGDALNVTLSIVDCRKVRLVAAQDVTRNGQTLASARVVLACIDPRTWRPARIPESMLAPLENVV